MKPNRLTYTFIVLLSLCVIIAVSVRYLEKEVLISGKTMGTTYHIKIVLPFYKSSGSFKKAIDRELDNINLSMSTYRNDSEISRFNSHHNAGDPFPVSQDFYTVMKTAQTIYMLSGGAWDGTVKPLIDLWGFGKEPLRTTLPDPAEIKSILENVGFDNIMITDDNTPDKTLVKKRGDISLDLASIAKGYGVDVISRYLTEEGVENYLVEIGGEVYAKGERKDHVSWRVGINTPEKMSAPDAVYEVVALKNTALATSGDYRNFIEIKGQSYSHIIDPRTGYPITNGVISVSVAAETCVMADGLATAIMVMGPEAGIEMVDKMKNVECLIIVKDGNDGYADHYSEHFRELLYKAD